TSREDANLMLSSEQPAEVKLASYTVLGPQRGIAGKLSPTYATGNMEQVGGQTRKTATVKKGATSQPDEIMWKGKRRKNSADEDGFEEDTIGSPTATAPTCSYPCCRQATPLRGR
ncbi:hypothetical protein MMC31_006257, partial [Peltigera leucophlebia]|nr:hypothetical protein [Peltigera leucophlebia]